MLMLPLTPVSVSLLVPVPSWLPWLLLVPWLSSLPVPLSLLLSSCRSERRWRQLCREEVAGKDMIEWAWLVGQLHGHCAPARARFSLGKWVSRYQNWMGRDILECFSSRICGCLLSCFISTRFPVQHVTRVGHGAFGTYLVFFSLFLVFFPTLPPFPFFSTTSSSPSSSSVTFLGRLHI